MQETNLHRTYMLERRLSVTLSKMAVLKDFLVNGQFLIYSLHEKQSFSLRISSINVAKSEGNCGLGHIYWRNP